ncbi:MAG: pectinesterase family protein [Paludibacter sp.]|nr:pectinesterase family protein [Paludibacter sp.]
MKKQLLYFIVLLVGTVGMNGFIQAATPAVASWPLVSAGVSTSIPTTSGQVDAVAESLTGIILGSGATASVGTPALVMQRLKDPAGTGWPAETVKNAGRYIQFAASPKAGSILTVDTISVTIGTSGGTSVLKASVYYSTDPTFVTSTQLGSNTLLGNTIYSRFKYSALGIVLNPGQTIYVRVYAWNSSAAAITGKYITLLNMAIGGSTDPVPVSSSIVWPCISNITSSVVTGTMLAGTTALSNLINYGNLSYTPVGGQSIYTGTVWQAETAPAEGRYIQFAASPKSGGVLVVDSVKFKLAAFATTDFKVSVFYSKDPAFTLSTGTQLGPDVAVSNGAFTKTLTPLTSNNTFNSGETMYLRFYPYHLSTSGDQWKLVGLDSISVCGKVTGVTSDPPTISTAAVTGISTTFVSTGGTISSDGGAAVTDRGIVYSSTNTTPTIADTKIQTGSGSGSFSTQLTGLTAGTTYYACAYAVNSAGTSYGTVVTFNTMAALTTPVLTTTAISSILAKTASGGGAVTDWGGSSVTVRGICWSRVNAIPTIADSICTNGSGIGAYTGSLSQLVPSTTYYVSAYATNSTGTGYGPVVTFTTQAVAADVVKTVGKDGCSDYSSIQAAFTAVPDNYTGRWIIYVKNGTYYEKCLLAATKPNVALIGQNVDSCIVTFDDYAGKPSGGGTFGTNNSYSVAIDASDFYAQNITFRNTIKNTGTNTYSSGGDQAVALRTKGDRQQYYNCKLLGYQDTYYTNSNGRIYMKKCYIAGSVDFIFGNGVMVLDSCTTYVNREGGVNCAPNTDAASAFGYVFLNCTLTSLPAGTVGFDNKAMVSFYLGRPWQNNPKVAYIKCVEPATLNTAGWTSMSTGLSPVFAEYQCTGPGSATTGRATNVDFPGIQLSDAQALNYTISNIFSKNTNTAFSYNWLPSPVLVSDVFVPVTVTTPVNGKLSVVNCSTNVISGDIVPVGASLTVTATPDSGYQLESSGLTANNISIISGANYIPNAATAFVATFSIGTGLNNGSEGLHRIYCANNLIHLGETADNAKVYNVQGKLLLIGNNTSILDVSGIPAGIYIVKVSVKGQTSLSKVTK